MSDARSRKPRGIRGQRAAPGWLVVAVLILLAVARMWSDPPGGPHTAPQGDTSQQPLPGSVENGSGGDGQVENGPVAPAGESTLARVRRVVDGDTLLLQNGERVRLLGVDTPETKKEGVPVQPFGPEASDFTTRLAEGKTVRLEFDRERYDQYQRILAYVYVGDVFLNEEVIRQGFSTAQVQYPYRADMKKRFTQAEAEARGARRGIWSLPQAVPRQR